MNTKPERKLEDPSFFDCYIDEQWNQLRAGHPKRTQKMIETIVETYKTTSAQTVEAFVDECHMAFRSKHRLTTAKGEIEARVMSFLWSALASARAEIAKFPERMRKRRSEAEKNL